MQVQAMINKILFLSISLSFCLHASTSDTPQIIGWSKDLLDDVQGQLTDARQGLLKSLGWEQKFEKIDWDQFAQARINLRNRELMQSQTPLIVSSPHF